MKRRTEPHNKVYIGVTSYYRRAYLYVDDRTLPGDEVAALTFADAERLGRSLLREVARARKIVPLGRPRSK